MQLSIEIDELFLSGISCKSCGNSSVGSLCSHCQKICFHVKNNEVSSSILLAHNSKSEFNQLQMTQILLGVTSHHNQRDNASLLCCIITQALDNIV